MPPPPEALPAERELVERNAMKLSAQAASSKSVSSLAAGTVEIHEEDQSLLSLEIDHPAQSGSQVERSHQQPVSADSTAAAPASAVPNLPLPREPEELSKDLPPAGPFSDQIHIAGFNVQARYLLHALAGQEHLPPVQLLTQHQDSASYWDNESRSVAVYDYAGNLISRRPILCPQYVGRSESRLQKNAKPPTMLNNLVVSLHDHTLFPLIRRLKKHIDQHTTICLLLEGLGYIEDLNEQIFDDPKTRPQYILGFSHHKIRKHPGSAIAVRHRGFTSGTSLYLCAPNEGPFVAGSAPQTQAQNFLKLLSSSPEVRPKRLAWNRFIQRKLPDIIFSSLADSISVMLGCRYDKIVTQPIARKLWKAMLAETLTIIEAMPEIEPKIMQYFLKPQFRAELWGRLTRQAGEESPWINLIRRGWRPPTNHINGYFIRQAKALGIDHKHNATALSIVEFKYHLRRDDLNRGIAFGNLAQQSYMTDEGGYDDMNPLPFEDDSELDASGWNVPTNSTPTDKTSVY